MDNPDYWISNLNLVSHPEGGYYKETYRSTEIIPAGALPERFGGDGNQRTPRAFSTSIYFLLKCGEPSKFHRIASDETWYFHFGDPLLIHMIGQQGDYSKVVIGHNPDRDQLLQYTVPYGVWFAAEVPDEGKFSLVSCSVSPGFDFVDFSMAGTEDLLALAPEKRELIRRLTS